ncbi:hypothetical protein TrVE_jg7567 [Triparma verrucosa]|uniref:Uncharacterized protein n=1 Tax=Triparma verrucosa TaxID=1606542 RepID=A0A9W7BT32_9STRA|nr:hypothetical protein TrVE_jg7567 [Triparma verrucosa]
MTEIPLMIFLIIPVITWMFFAVLSVFYLSWCKLLSALREKARSISLIVVDVSPAVASLPPSSPLPDASLHDEEQDISLRSSSGEKIKRSWSFFPFPWLRRTSS